MELALLLFAFGDLPLAMANAGGLVLGPQPWFALPLGPVQIFTGFAGPPLSVRFHLLRGPWFLWGDFPGPRFALGRVPGPALLAFVRDLRALDLSWELLGSPWLSLFGSLGSDHALGLRFRVKQIWFAGLIRKGGLSLWCGVYFLSSL